MQDLAKLESDLNKLAFDQKQSKTNYEKMKMQFKRDNTKAKLKKRKEERLEDSSDGEVLPLGYG